MLKCGECTFLKEAPNRCLSCSHPQRLIPIIEKMRIGSKEYPVMNVSPKLADIIYEMLPKLEYETECLHEYNDVWAARGAAKLIWDDTPPVSDDVQKFTQKFIAAQKNFIAPSPVQADPLRGAP